MFRSSLVAYVGLKRALNRERKYLKLSLHMVNIAIFQLTFPFSSTVFESAVLCYNQYNSVYVLHEL